MPLYAKARVPEVWLVDLEGEAIEVLRHPSRGRYLETVRATRTETMAPLAFPDLVVDVGVVLGPGRKRARS